MVEKNSRFRHLVLYYSKSLISLLLELISSLLTSLFKPKRSRIPPITNKILLISAIELSKRIRSGELKCKQVVETYIEQIRNVNPIINAVTNEHFTKALEEAQSIDLRLEEARKGKGDSSILHLPLLGIPLTIKETISLKDSSYTAGLPRRRLFRAKASNEAVEKLMRAGLIPICSTNIPCMNMWWDTDNKIYGRTLNPYDLTRTVGGSSGGEAALLAAAGSVVGLGSDLGGSIRMPCSFCGVFGHKPTPFVVSNDGIFPAMTYSQEKLRGVGPMTRYACDLKPMLKLMAKESELSKLNLDESIDLKQLKIFYCQDLGDPLAAKCDKDILNGLQAAVSYLSNEYGLTAERVYFEEFKYGLSLWSAEANTDDNSLEDSNHEDRLDNMNPAAEFFNLLYRKSDYTIGVVLASSFEKLKPTFGSKKHTYLTERAAQLREKFYKLIGNKGVLLMPTHPQAAPHHLSTVFRFMNVSYTAVANTLQAPITHCPIGMSREGLPFGLQIISKPYNDSLCIAVAQELEKVFGGWLPPARVNA